MPARVKQLKGNQKRTTTPSDLLADLHVYILPVDKWIPFRRLARNTVVEETVSAGFVRVSPTKTLLELRDVLGHQLDLDFPQHYVFIRSVGRNFTQVKTHQESILKVKHFLPPQANEPEIHVLEVNPDLIKKTGSVPNLLLSDTDYSDTQGLTSLLTGRISHAGIDGRETSRSGVYSRLQLSQNPVERIRSLTHIANGNDYEEAGEIISYDFENGIEHRLNEKGTTDEDEDYQISYKQSRESRLHSTASMKINQKSTSMRRKKAILRDGVTQVTQLSSGEESGANTTSGIPRRRSEIAQRRSSGLSSFNNIRRSASLNVLPRSASQESIAEERDKMGRGFRPTGRKMDRTRSRTGQRSVSVSAIEGKRTVSGRRNFLGYEPSEKPRRHTHGGDNRYTPHKWKLEREAKMLEREVQKRTKLMEEELEALREAQKAEEARRFEEQLRLEEQMYKEHNIERKPSDNTSQILNLEGEVPIEEIVEIDDVCLRNTDVKYSPRNIPSEEKVMGRLIGDGQQGYEITYELEFSGNEEYGADEFEPEEGVEAIEKEDAPRQDDDKGRGRTLNKREGRRRIGNRIGKGLKETGNKEEKGNLRKKEDKSVHDGVKITTTTATTTTNNNNNNNNDNNNKGINDRKGIRGRQSRAMESRREEYDRKNKKKNVSPNKYIPKETENLKQSKTEKNAEDKTETSRDVKRLTEKQEEVKHPKIQDEIDTNKANRKVDRLEVNTQEKVDNSGSPEKVSKPEVPGTQKTKGAWAEKDAPTSTNESRAVGMHDGTPYAKEGTREHNESKQGTEKKISNKLFSSNPRKKRPNNSSFKRAAPQENIEEVKREKEMYEDRRTELFRRARSLHEQILTIKEKKRQKWWEEYNNARRKGARLEERQANLRQELETLYRKVLGTLMKKQPLVTGIRDEPSRKASYKISVVRLRHEIADLVRRVEAIDIKLQAEKRLRQQAEKEVKQLRSEVNRKKANVALSQSRAPLLRNIAFIPDDILVRL